MRVSDSMACSTLAWNESSSLHGRHYENVVGGCLCLFDSQGRRYCQYLLTVPLHAQLSLLMEGLSDDSEMHLALTIVLPFVTGSRSRPIPVAVMDAMPLWKPYEIPLQPLRRSQHFLGATKMSMEVGQRDFPMCLLCARRR